MQRLAVDSSMLSCNQLQEQKTKEHQRYIYKASCNSMGASVLMKVPQSRKKSEAGASVKNEGSIIWRLNTNSSEKPWACAA